MVFVKLEASWLAHFPSGSDEDFDYEERLKKITAKLDVLNEGSN